MPRQSFTPPPLTSSPLHHLTISSSHHLTFSPSPLVSLCRYISHELRTPMNTACLGLSMMLSDTDTSEGWRDRGSPADVDKFETLSDINTCSTAVDILNDLLSFEKMESGILELHSTHHVTHY